MMERARPTTLTEHAYASGYTILPAQVGALFTVSFFNDWVEEHIAGYQPHGGGGNGATPHGAGLGVTPDLALLGDARFAVSG